MSEYLSANYQVRDPQGNVYGPATGSMLRDWVGQGRIVAGMHIADVRDGNWVEVSQHPALADLFGGMPGGTQAAQPYSAPASPNMGYTPQPPAPVDYQTSGVPKQNVLGLIGMIAGIVAVVGGLFSCVPLCNCVGLPLGGLSALAAIVLGAIGLVQVKKNPELYRGAAMSITGLCMGIAGIVLMVIMIIVMVVMNMRH